MEASRDILSNKRAINTLALVAAAAALAASVKLAPTVISDGKKIGKAIERELDAAGGGGTVSAKRSLDALQLAGFPQRREVAGPGDGFDDLSLRANLHSDMFSSGQVMAERRYLRDELEQRTGRRELWEGDVLDVPVLPDER